MMASTDPQQAAVCLHGHGIVCGLTMQVNPNCDIEQGSGSAILRDGTIAAFNKQIFSYYLKEPSAEVQAFFPHTWDEKTRANRPVLELVPAGHYDSRRMDSLKQQGPKDLPTRNLLDDKVAVVMIDPKNPEKRWHLLVSPSLLVEKDPALLQAVKALSKNEAQEGRAGIFKRNNPNKAAYPKEVIMLALYPHLQLPRLILPRFGYKKLGIIDDGQPFGTDNFKNPFGAVSLFSDIFYEYKAILDDFIPAFADALEKLHECYAPVLTHKEKSYLERYRRILLEKWQVFLYEGESLFYIKYFYDWLSDLLKAYGELCAALSRLEGECLCGTHDEKGADKYLLLRLGPVLGGRSGYTPLIFRDYFVPPMSNGDAADRLNEARFLHWRLLMMIWTFDLPQLKLDQKVLVAGRYVSPAKEFEDSTDFYENTDADANKSIDLEDVPLKLTPGQTPDRLLGEQAIPYYYPLDADSPYSLHRYWNYRASLAGHTQWLRSYNAMDFEDSYSRHRETVYPLAFSLRNWPYLRAEGHIGKKTTITAAAAGIPLAPDWQSLAVRYNLSAQFALVPVSGLQAFLDKQTAPVQWPGDPNLFGATSSAGMEHTGGLVQGDIFVMVYVDASEGEQIELSECRKDVTPEMGQLVIVADFTMPGPLKL